MPSRPIPPDRHRRGPRVGAKAQAAACATGSAAALAMAALTAPAVALDLDGNNGLITETVASRDRLKFYDSSKLYGAERVMDRNRTPFQPDGIRAGPVMILPSIGAAVVFDDNILQSNSERVKDLRSEVTPGLRIRSQLPRHHFDLSLAGKIVTHLENPEQDYADASANFNGALHFDHAHTLATSLLTALEHELPRDPGTPDKADRPVAIWHNRATAGVTRDVGRLYGTLSTTADSYDFQDARTRSGQRLDQDHRDTDVLSTQLRMAYRFSPGYEAVAKVRGLRQLNTGTATLDRDAWGYEALAGLAGEVSPLLRWRLLGGWGIRDYDQNGLSSVESTLVEGQVQWLPRQDLTLYLTIGRAIADSIGDDGNQRIDTVARGRAEYEISHQIVGTLDLELRDTEAVGADRRDRTYTGRIGVDYYHTKNWLFTFGYEHQERQSSDDRYDLSRNIFSIGAKLRF